MQCTIETIPSIELFATDDFRNSPYIQDLCKKMQFVKITDTVFPPGHFGAYFEIIPKKSLQYSNWYIHDLYCLHELCHLVRFQKMEYESSWSWLKWARCINTIESEVSLATECMIYFHIHGLRKKTFSHEIWVDRYAGLKGNSITYIEARLREKRFTAYNNPDPRDFLAQQIRAYAALNMQWCQIWAHPVGYGAYVKEPAFRVVENHRKSGFSHQEWIKEVTDPNTGIPFAHQAKEFENVFLENKKWFDNEVLMT